MTTTYIGIDPLALIAILAELLGSIIACYVLIKHNKLEAKVEKIQTEFHLGTKRVNLP